MGVRPKVFINGISGMLGYALALRLRHSFLVTGSSFRNQVFIPGVQAYPVTLVKGAEALEALVHVQRPDILISAVGINDRKEVDEQPKVADMINIVLPVSMAVLAGRLKTKYVFLSCAEVFDGEKGGYAEEDNDFTLSDSVGKQKIAAHSFIRAQTLESTTLRVGRVLGLGHPQRTSFFDRIRDGAARKKPLEASKRKKRSYISTRSFTEAVEQVLLGEFPARHRTLHVGGANITEFELIESWYRLMGAEPGLVTELQDTRRDLSLSCKAMEQQFPAWRAETKGALLENLLEDLSPGVGTKRWQKTLQELSDTRP